MKLSLDALKERAQGIASEELMGQITGGLLPECHNGSCTPKETPTTIKDTTPTVGSDGTLYLPRG
ncbi:hypothetical protein [Flavobacterium xanthum]|jgi:hypothetical protein|uniref:Uncharacterized protein n=1 Tax=Flavobacterium xanthum TaxID=69322 RepID=A0A1M7L855_9FLAO|nr:hypothetical protein [Flavobacterium xanthum]SHM73574.1 hypothetical protein SAMN05443669_106310 [Flavobacterium xanthum]